MNDRTCVVLVQHRLSSEYNDFIGNTITATGSGTFSGGIYLGSNGNGNNFIANTINANTYGVHVYLGSNNNGPGPVSIFGCS